ncbi:hypothetical protein Q73A0000_02550 [Kaistella flava (ex Peng et al. 2021)]|uniref:Uncharacterized protein n=1 Tax=Kaistella flava (ex Peng et al. 2021) TaxID=2038776 RepID=A0A7M2Y6R1_9FLAO|nr:hypothetical protein [Kaistella flava (ex Peng et al. 2021)]QOW09315.1 hypothetical protein Q73A0000_02550 [Kaistella flava (ex Peng et al. 2021)]
MNFESSISKDDFEKNLSSLLKSSKSENVFNLSVNDFSIRGKISEGEFLIEKKIEGRSPINYKIEGKIDCNSLLNISVTIKPKIMGIVFSLIFICFSFYFTRTYTVPLIATGFIYIITIITFRLYTTWVQDLFEKKLLKKDL